MQISMKTTVILVVLLAALVILAGCARKTAEPGGTVTPPRLSGATPGEQPSPGGAAPAGELKTLADVWAKLNGHKSYAVTMQVGQKKMTQLIKLESGKPTKMRMENFGGEEGTILLDLKQNIMYWIAAKENKALKVDMSGASPEEKKKALEQVLSADTVESSVSLQATETLDGVTCWVVETKTTCGGGTARPAKVWINQKTGLPVQIKSDDQIVKLSYSRMDEIADSEFELPKGLQVVDMETMLKQATPKPTKP